MKQQGIELDMDGEPQTPSQLIKKLEGIRTKFGDEPIHFSAGHNNIECYIEVQEDWLVFTQEDRKAGSKTYIVKCDSADGLVLDIVWGPRAGARKYTDHEVDKLLEVAKIMHPELKLYQVRA